MRRTNGTYSAAHVRRGELRRSGVPHPIIRIRTQTRRETKRARRDAVAQIHLSLSLPSLPPSREKVLLGEHTHSRVLCDEEEDEEDETPSSPQAIRLGARERRAATRPRFLCRDTAAVTRERERERTPPPFCSAREKRAKTSIYSAPSSSSTLRARAALSPAGWRRVCWSGSRLERRSSC